MSSTESQGLTTDIAGLQQLVGRHAGYTEWEPMEQSRVDLFADATDDHQYIHVDPEKAKQSPFGGTIAHGYLTLSLVAPVLGQLVRVTDAAHRGQLRPGPRSLSRAAAGRRALARRRGAAGGVRGPRRRAAEGAGHD